MLPGTIVLWWSISGEGAGPRCGVTVTPDPDWREPGDWLFFVEVDGGEDLAIRIDTMPPEHRPRRVGVVDQEGRPRWDV